MQFPDEVLDRIFHRTGGRCHLCGSQLSRPAYGRVGVRDGWEVDHSHARANGGSDHGNNLFAAHIACNRSRQAKPVQAIRRANGLVAPPMSTAQREQLRAQRVIGFGTLCFGLVVLAGGGPVAILAGVLGAALGSESV